MLFLRLPKPVRQRLHFFHHILLPGHEGMDPLAGKLIAYAAKSSLMRSCAGVYLAAARLCPFRHITGRIDAARTAPVLLLAASRATLTASGHRRKINVLIHLSKSLSTSVCHHCAHAMGSKRGEGDAVPFQGAGAAPLPAGGTRLSPPQPLGIMVLHLSGAGFAKAQG